MLTRHCKLSKTSSFFLFGPRGSGKTTLLNEYFKSTDAMWVNLLDPEEDEAHLLNPKHFYEKWKSMNPRPKWIVIDEVQKHPKILDVVHLMIEAEKVFFALTGSSARKLKRGASNLLAGRAFVFNLHPFSAFELNFDIDLNDLLKWGMLPKVFQFEDEQDKYRFLKSYTQTYLKEEIQAEQIIRKIAPFRKFLELSAQANGEIINFSKISRQTGVDHKTVSNYFQILEDTLLGFFLDSYSCSIRKKQIESPRFYYFDTGVANVLNGHNPKNLTERTYHYGKVFEHFVIIEIRKKIAVTEREDCLCYLKTHDGLEIDLIIQRSDGPDIFIEIKSSNIVENEDVKHLKTVAKEIPDGEFYLLNSGNSSMERDGIKIRNWKVGIEEIISK